MRFFKFIIILLIPALTIVSCSDDDCTIDNTLIQTTSEVTEIGPNHHRVYTDIIIDESASKVWQVLTDFDNMPNWSTSFQGLTGDISDGGQVVAIFIIQGNTVNAPHTLTYEEGVKYGWSDPVVGLAGITDNHMYIVEPISDCQTRFIQSDEFSGTNANTTTLDIANSIQPTYELFNTELKTEAEK